MAVTKEIKGLHVTIMLHQPTGFKNTREYRATGEEQPGNVVTKYTRADTGKQFGIKWNFQPNFVFKDDHIMSAVYLDGQFADSLAFDSKLFQGSKSYKYMLGGARVKKDGKWYQLPFSFANLDIDEDNNGLNDAGLKESVSSLGEITVRFWRVEKTGESECGNRMSSFKTLGTIPEKALKGRAVSQQASLGDAQPIDDVMRPWDMSYLDPLHKPFAVFNFRYRSRSGLQALGLMATTPFEEHNVKSLSKWELRELVQKQEEQLDVDSEIKMNPELKREREDGDDGADDGAERETKRQSRSHDFEGIETIDLTGD